jgi:hypothetical protein
VRLSAIGPARQPADGRFALTARITGSTVRLTGRLAGRRLRGARAAIATTVCSGSLAVRALRTDE